MIRPSRLAVAALVSVAALSGCGVSDEEIRPGVAAEVGDTQITIDELDEAVDGACAYFTAQAAGTTIPRADVRNQLLELLVKRAAAEQMLEDNDAELDPGYEGAVKDTENNPQLADVPDAQRDGFVTGSEADYFYQAAVLGAGVALLVDEGVTEYDAPAAQARGTQAFNEWVAEHDIVVNPLFGVGVEDGQIALTSTDELAVAASDLSVLGAKEPSAPGDPVREAYAASLPADQTCG